MQQFTVPQFIDVEDKIIGPVTTRQFIIVLAGCLLIAVCYKLFDFSLFVTVAVVILGLCGTFAFARVNGRPFHFFVLNIIQTLKRPKLRVWHKREKAVQMVEEIEEKQYMPAVGPLKHYTASRLSELSLIVDTKGAYRGEAEGEADNDEIDIKMEK